MAENNLGIIFVIIQEIDSTVIRAIGHNTYLVNKIDIKIILKNGMTESFFFRNLCVCYIFYFILGKKHLSSNKFTHNSNIIRIILKDNKTADKDQILIHII